MTKRKRSDSAAGHTDIVRGALSGAPKPPKGVTISEAVRPFWELVTMAKAKRAWTANDLVVAAEVARCMQRLEVVSSQLEAVYTGPLDINLDTVKELEKLADQLAKRVRMLSAHIQIHAEATQGKSREQVTQNETHAEAAAGAKSYSDDDLIAKPVH